MMDDSPRVLGVDPNAVIVPLGNVYEVTVLRVEDGTQKKKPKRRYVRRTQEEETKDA